MSETAVGARLAPVAAPAVRVIDRHAFASNASAFDTAWRTFGWTPAIAGPRAGRLEESVPWATLAATAERPGQLRGRADTVLAPDNLDRLQYAFVPLDGRLAFSVWGAIGREAGGAGWRVLTHTLLFDRATFDVIAGHPFGLLTDPESGAWFREMVEAEAFDQPRELMPVRIPDEPDTRARFESARLCEVARLRDRLRAHGGRDGAAAEHALAAAYETLAAVAAGQARRAAVRGRGPADALLVRLAWLSLPLEDRAAVFFSTEQRRMENPAATLAVLPRAEWGDAMPEATRLIEPGAHEEGGSPGRRFWAQAVCAAYATAGRDTSGYASFSARASVRGWSIIARDDAARLAPLHDWRARTTGCALALDDARDLIAIEMAGGPRRVRARALGHVVGRAARGHGGGPLRRAEVAASLLRELAVSHRIPGARAAVRALERGSVADRQAAGFLRLCASGTENGLTPVDELLRLTHEERGLLDDLLDHPEGPLALFHGAAMLASDHPAPAELLARAAIARLPERARAVSETLGGPPLEDPRAARWASVVLAAALADRHLAADVERIIEAADAGWLARDETVARLTESIDRLVDSAGGAERAAHALLSKILTHANVRVSDALVESLLRLSWIELQSGPGPTTVERHAAADGRAAVPLLAHLLVATPPLPLFLRLRRALLAAPLAHLADQPALEALRSRLREVCPSLAERLPTERSDHRSLVLHPALER